jgi:hypothetical protein
MAESRLITLAQVKEQAANFLSLNKVDGNMIDVAVATKVANQFDGDPLWFFLNGPPSHAKTEVLNSMRDYPGVELLSSITKNTLLSGKSIKDKEGNVKNCSLLFNLNDKLVVIKDFTTILSLHANDRTEIYSQLREIYDGSYKKAYGTGDVVSWQGKIGILAAVTPAIDRQISVNALLGERFLHYRVFGDNRVEAAKCALRHTTGTGGPRKAFREIMTDFLNQFDELTDVNVEIDDNTHDKLAALACFCSIARASVIRSRYDQTLEAMPEAEGPSRLAKQFKLLATALAVVRDQKSVGNDVYQVIAKVAKDTMPRLRLVVLEAMWRLNQREENWYTTKEIALESGLPTTTAKMKLENLHVLGLLERQTKSEGETAAYQWSPSKNLTSMVRTGEVFTT